MLDTLPESALGDALRAKLTARQTRAELASSVIFCVTILTIFLLVSTLGTVRSMPVFAEIRAVFVGFFVLLAGLGLAAWRGWWHPALPYVNSALQVTVLTVLLVLTARSQGVSVALSTVLPMLYGLTIALTAFRLNPWLSVFAGGLVSAEFVASYLVFLRPLLSAEDLATVPVVAWPSVVARVIVFLATGGACALAAASLRRQIKHAAVHQSRIHLLERTFGRLVAPEVARQILENEDWMRPARREAVVMFADLQGFTKYSEGRNPEDVADFLNRCWTVAAESVERHGGVINKYMGDGFLAIFGVPMEMESAEIAAAETAAELQEKLAPLLEPEGLALCIGLHAGPMIVGGIGSESRCEFTVIGSTVNLASRLETLNRSLDTRCLTSEPVAAKIAAQWETTHRGGQRVKGVTDEVSVFELGGKKPPAEPEPPHTPAESRPPGL